MLLKLLLYVQAVFYVVAGANHFLHPAFYEKMMPPGLPWPSELQLLAGAAEVLLGIGLIPPKTRQLAAWGLIALLIAVFPANIYLAMHPDLMPGTTQTMQWVRLPVQLLFLAGVYRFTKPS